MGKKTINKARYNPEWIRPCGLSPGPNTQLMLLLGAVKK